MFGAEYGTEWVLLDRMVCNTLGGLVGPLVSYLSNNRSIAKSLLLSMGK